MLSEKNFQTVPNNVIKELLQRVLNGIRDLDPNSLNAIKDFNPSST